VRWWGVATIVLAAHGAWAQPALIHIEAAERWLSQRKYAKAQAELERASATPDNPREVVLRVLELQGISATLAKRRPKAYAYFLKLLSLDPARDLPYDAPPKALPPFYDARDWVARHEAVQIERLAALSEGGLLQGVRAAVRGDTQHLARRLRFHVRAREGPWNTMELPVDEAGVLARMEGRRIQWWVEALNDAGGVLLSAGSDEEPWVDEGGEAPAATPASAVPPAPPPAQTPPPSHAARAQAVVVQRSTAEPRYRPLAYGAAGAGLLALGVGSGLGLLSTSQRNQLSNATRDAAGNITSISQSTAYGLDSAARLNAALANTFFVAGSLLAAGGVGLWWWGGQARVTVAPGGLALEGTFR